MRRAAKRVLQQADDRAHDTAADGVAPRNRKEDHHHHRQIEDRQPAQLCRQKCLDEDGNERDEDDRKPIKFIGCDLLPRGVASAEWHGRRCHCGGGSPALGGVVGDAVGCVVGGGAWVASAGVVAGGFCAGGFAVVVPVELPSVCAGFTTGEAAPPAGLAACVVFGFSGTDPGGVGGFNALAPETAFGAGGFVAPPVPGLEAAAPGAELPCRGDVVPLAAPGEFPAALAFGVAGKPG